jgi:hypothetical protein
LRGAQKSAQLNRNEYKGSHDEPSPERTMSIHNSFFLLPLGAALEQREFAPPVREGINFKALVPDMSRRPEGTTLGRFGDVGDYKPSNCKWMTGPEQGAEKRKKPVAPALVRKAAA